MYSKVLLFSHCNIGLVTTRCLRRSSYIPPVLGSATLTGAQEVPSVTTSATGLGGVAVDPTTKLITGGITSITGMTAYIQMAAAGANGVAIITLNNAGGGVWNIPVPTVLSQTQYDALLANGLYFNVNSTANPTGEIRWQINIKP